MKEATVRILEWISRIRPAYARTLRWELARMGEEDQLDRVVQVLAAITPTESRPPERSGPRKAFFDELRTATEKLEKATEKLASTLEK